MCSSSSAELYAFSSSPIAKFLHVFFPFAMNHAVMWGKWRLENPIHATLQQICRGAACTQVLTRLAEYVAGARHLKHTPMMLISLELIGIW